MLRALSTTLFLVLLASTVLGGQSPGLGQKDPGLLNLRGSIYFLDDAASMPDDLATRKVEGVIYADKLDVPERSFTEGFPGVTDRFEWFAVLYEGNFETPIAGTYGFRLNSDDGSRLFIDGKEVIDNDGVHGANEVSGSVDLTRGRHTMKVWYFQGPATEIALQLWITPPKGKEKIFSLADYSLGLSKALSDVMAEATPQGIRMSLDAALLFDSAKWDVKQKAQHSIASVATVLQAYPGAKVRIEGHTDSDGDEASNQVLSEKRAHSVEQALRKAGVPSALPLEVKGFGESQPMADNNTAKGKAKNRRVEIYVVP